MTFDVLRSIVAAQFHVHSEALLPTTIIAALPGSDRPYARTTLLIRLEEWFQVRLHELTLCDAMSLGELAEAIDDRCAGFRLQAAE